MKQLFQAPATIQSVRTLVDGGVKLDVNTQELGADDLTKLFELKGRIGWFVFSDSTITDEDIPSEEIDVTAGEVSPAKRLRSKLFIYWKDHTNQTEPFDTYYRRAIQREIDKIDEKLL